MKSGDARLQAGAVGPLPAVVGSMVGPLSQKYFPLFPRSSRDLRVPLLVNDAPDLAGRRRIGQSQDRRSMSHSAWPCLEIDV